MIRTARTALLIGAMMFTVGIGTMIARQGANETQAGPSLDTLIPKHFGDWMEEPIGVVKVVDPQLQDVLDADYSQVVNRFYINPERYLIMVSVAYGSGGGPLKLHKPETCYSGDGFTVLSTDTSRLATSFGEIPVRRLLTRKGPREEQVMYWLRVGDQAVPAWQSKLVELAYMVTGRTADGLIFRISSIDRDPSRALRLQSQFVEQLLGTITPAERRHLSGLGDLE